jgi:hypothetical protein
MRELKIILIKKVLTSVWLSFLLPIYQEAGGRLSGEAIELL